MNECSGGGRREGEAGAGDGETKRAGGEHYLLTFFKIILKLFHI